MALARAVGAWACCRPAGTAAVAGALAAGPAAGHPFRTRSGLPMASSSYGLGAMVAGRVAPGAKRATSVKDAFPLAAA